MKQISIHRQGKLTNQARFEDPAKAQEWLDGCLAKKKFGQPERFKAEDECSEEEKASAIGSEKREIVPGSPQIVDDNNQVLTPAQLPIYRKFLRLPSQFEVKIEDIEPNYKDLRREQYVKRIDPKYQEATLENMIGRPEKMQALLTEYEAIKAQFPRR